MPPNSSWVRVVLFLLLILSCSLNVLAQDKAKISKRIATASPSAENIVIDGKINELAWQNAEVLSGFITNEPDPGLAADKDTEVRVLYNSESIYVAAFMPEDGKDKVLSELSQRDNFSNSDYFAVFIDAYRDGINGVGFFVTSAGVQLDSKSSALGQDYSWNAVWRSEVQITDTGWVVEMEIPYSALRFPEAQEQEWHINFCRSIRRIREVSYWNFLNPEVDGFFNQSGLLKGIEDVKTPVRLQLYPYLSGYLNTFQGEQSYSVNGGMDVKYGLSDAFTLDMTLIPDFGQVQSDNQVFNVSPFEVRFNENRQFFTEGTELFNKGGLFYSRRIGGTPINFGAAFSEVKEGEELVENPSQGKLVNATKISGRTKQGLGVGVFNAVSAPTYAIIKEEDGNERTFQTDPLTNYSVLVLDQNLKNNSYVTLINTNVLRNGATYDANVVGTQFRVRDKKNVLQVNGGGAYNKKYNFEGPDDGYTHYGSVSKISGNLNFGAGYTVESDTYDPNDLGFLFNNNEFSKYVWLSYNQYKSIWFLNRFGINLNVGQSTLFQPEVFTDFYTNLNGFFIAKSFDSFGFGLTRNPLESYDYFEARRDGYVFVSPTQTGYNAWFSSDYRRTFALDVSVNGVDFDYRQGPYFNYRISPRVRVNNQLSFVYSISNNARQSEFGYAFFNARGSQNAIGFDANQVYIGKRDRDIHEQVLNVNYIFTNKMGLTARIRHYWTKVEFEEFYELQRNGDLVLSQYRGQDATGESVHNTSFNAFNIDLVFRWVFSPGSEISIVWKDAILTASDVLANNYFDNARTTFGAPRSDSFSVKVLYFVDYYNARKLMQSKRTKL